ncbi:MAG: sugar phosphate isomerase/epimerase [Planctomycetes bacterium]|nr:sugar phosphate isomerase/epimerase [Planctomycetota bacterium]
MLRIRVGVQLASLRRPLKQALHTAAELGAEAVEIDARNELRPQEMTRTAVRHLRKMTNDLGLRVSAVSFRTRRGYETLEELDRRVEATRQAMSLAWELGATAVVNRIGDVPEKPEGPQWELLVQVLADLGRHGQRVGATLAADTGGEDPQRLAALIAALPVGSLGVNLNPGNLVAGGRSATEAAALLGPHTLHVHAKDGTRDVAQGRGVETPLGRGSVDWPAVFGALEEHDYRGYFTIERPEAADPVKEIGQAVQFLRSF